MDMVAQPTGNVSAIVGDRLTIHKHQHPLKISYGSSDASNQLKPSTSTRKTQTKKGTTAKKQSLQRVAENDEPVSTQPRQPTCAPLYMASKPGYTHLPICSGNQY
ncbi:TPA: hypothetical protein ACYSB1_002608 [Citrobacter braakii]